MYQIEEPKYFYLMFAVGALLLMYLLVVFWKRRKQKQFADLRLLDQLSPCLLYTSDAADDEYNVEMSGVGGSV